MSELEELFVAAREQLRGTPQEALGEWTTPRALFGVKKAPRIVRVGSAWHVGSLLLTDDGVAAVGEVIRAQDPGRRGYTAESARARAEVRAAAVRGKFAEGTVVHIGWEPLDLAAVERGEVSGPLSVVDGVPMIRWSAAGGLAPLDRYLRERVELVAHPPAGANEP